MKQLPMKTLLPALAAMLCAAPFLPAQEATPVYPAGKLLWTAGDYEAGEGRIWRTVNFTTVPGMLYTLQSSPDLKTWSEDQTFYGLGHELGIGLFPIHEPPPPEPQEGDPPTPPADFVPLVMASVRLDPLAEGAGTLLSFRSLDDGSAIRFPITETLSADWPRYPFWSQRFGTHDFFLSCSLRETEPPAGNIASLGPKDAAMVAALRAHLPDIESQMAANLQRALETTAPPPREGARHFYRLRRISVDTDGDGIFDQDEMHDGLSSAFSGDTDGDGIGDAAERAAGTNPSGTDSDGDRVADSEDADPKDPLVSWKRTQAATYALIDIFDPDDPNHYASDINDKGEVLFYSSIWTGAGWESLNVPGTTGEWFHDHYLENNPDFLDAYETKDGMTMAFDNERRILAYTRRNFPDGSDHEGMPDWDTALAWDFGSTSSRELALYKPRAPYGTSWPIGITRDGYRYVSRSSTTDPDWEDDWTSDILVFPPSVTTSPQASPAEEPASFAPAGADAIGYGACLSPSGWLLANTQSKFGVVPTTYKLALWNPSLARIPLPAEGNGYHYPLHAETIPVETGAGLEEKPAVTAGGKVFLPDPAGTMRLAGNLGGKNLHVFSPDGSALAWDGLHLWRNGKFLPIKEVCPRYGEIKAQGHVLWPVKANKHGVYLIRHVTPEEHYGAKLMVPVLFENPRGPTHETRVRDCAPRVVLDAVSESAITVAGGTASVDISGKVYDAASALFPPDKATIPGVKIFLNGVEQSTTGTVTRNSADQGLWKPYGDTFTLAPLTFTFAASGHNRIRVETQPNVAGLKGSAEFEVDFRTKYTPGTNVPGHTTGMDILFDSALSETAVDTIHLAAPGAAPSIDLEETGVDTRLFRATSGHVLVIPPEFSPSAEHADELTCVLLHPGAPVSDSLRRALVRCPETGAATLRFSYSETIPGYEIPSTRSETLDSVTMGPVPGEHSGWFPFSVTIPQKMEGLKFSLLGHEFPVKETPHGIRATTAEEKPLVGIIIDRPIEPEDPEDDPLPPVREFLYYDHDAAAIVRAPVDRNAVGIDWKLMAGSSDSGGDTLPVKRQRFVDAAGNDSPGILPLPVEVLEEILEGGSPEITEEQYAYVEMVGHAEGEAVRFGNDAPPQDYFDLVAGTSSGVVELGTRQVSLAAAGERRFRSTQKVVIYTSVSDGRQTFTDAEWLSLRDKGYLVIHNDEKKVFWGKEDIEWLAKERGAFHPPAGLPMGLPGQTNANKAAFYQYVGYQDHHLFNAYHKNKGKALAWKQLFGPEFDVNEFTVPLRNKVHSKTQHLANKAWEGFLDEVFDPATGHLKTGITGKVLAEKRGEAFALMGGIAEEMGLNLDLTRPYPGMLESVPAGARNLHLIDKLKASEGRLGSSLNHLANLNHRYLMALGEEASETGRVLFKRYVKKLCKSGSKNALACLPFVFAYQGNAETLLLMNETMAFGPRVGAAVWLNNSIGLDDLPLAQRLVDQNFEKLGDWINGANAAVVAQLRSGDLVKVGDPSFTFRYNAAGSITEVVPYHVTAIWTFPNGRVKIQRTMGIEPFSVLESDEVDWFIDDWFPAVGESVKEWEAALRRAGAYNNYGN